MTVEFHGCYGGGDIIGIDLYPPGADTRSIHPDIVAELMDEVVTGPDGGAITIGKWIDDIVLGLLNHRHPGWTDNDGSCGEIELAWTTGDDGRLGLAIGGHVIIHDPDSPLSPMGYEGGIRVELFLAGNSLTSVSRSSLVVIMRVCMHLRWRTTAREKA